ncbi:hypothetical protein IHI26_01820 [Candidatus Parvarchaeota archaeon]|nr:hypothetical protein [Candidatus Acidifodinimicrobium mancum]
MTNFVSFISERERISKTSAWHTIRKLDSLGLINCGSSNNKGAPLILTDTGRIIAFSMLKDIEEPKQNKISKDSSIRKTERTSQEAAKI